MLFNTSLTLNAIAGAEFPLGRKKGAVILRYTHGVTSNVRPGQFYDDWSTRGLEVLLGVESRGASTARVPSLR